MIFVIGDQAWSKFNNLRTHARRVREAKSGDGAKQKTDREKWAISHLEFLIPHERNYNSRVAGTVSETHYTVKCQLQMRKMSHRFSISGRNFQIFSFSSY